MTKHRNTLEEILETPVAFALKDITNYKAEHLLEAGLPFVVLSKQIYLPFLGIALSNGRKKLSNEHQITPETLSPQTQRLALMALYNSIDGISVTQAAELLGTTKMTASRAFNELAAIDSSLIVTEGRRRILYPNQNKRTLWQQLKPYLSSPVVREYYLDCIPETNLPLSGVSAISELSMLEDNSWPTFAATRTQERDLKLTEIAYPAEFDLYDNPACVVQVMRYELVSITENAIDPLSAILSLSDDEKNDPRVKIEIEKVINQVFGDTNEGN